MSAEQSTDVLAVQRSRVGGVTYLIPPENLNTSEPIAQLQLAVDEAKAAYECEIIVDMSNVGMVNSEALELLLDIKDALEQAGGWIKLAKVNATIREILKLTGLSHSVNIVTLSSDPKPEVEPTRTSDSGQRLRMGDILIELKLVTPQQIEAAIALQNTTGIRLGEVLVKKKWVAEADMLSALAVQLEVDYCKLRMGLYDPETAKLLNRESAGRLGILPLFKVRGELTAATADPQAIPAIEEVEELTKCRVRTVLASLSEIRKHLDECHSGSDSTYDLLASLDADLDGDLDLENVEQVNFDDYSAIDEMADGSPVISLANSIIQRAVQEGASDIHIEPAPKQCMVRFRIDGVLYKVMTLKPEVYASLVSRLKVMGNMDIAERRMPQDGRIQVRTRGRSIDLRFSSLPGLHGEKVVLRVLDKANAILDVEKLGMTEENLATFKGLLSRNFGLVLVTGPTGSGKTTTLYAALNHMNSIEKNIVTIEDPVEYQMELISQNQVRDNIGLSFSKILRTTLRQDPDIILVGEIRDKETAEIAVQAALTGHLVLSTLHTNDSVGAVTRLIDMGVEPYLLSSALLGVVAQRLIRTICPECRTEFNAPPDVMKQYGWKGKNVKIARGRGCPECYDSGYKGRIGVHELLAPDEDLQRLIVSSPSRDELSDYMKRNNIKTLFDDGLLRVLDGKTTIEEVSRVYF